jgi:UPF0176 protein
MSRYVNIAAYKFATLDRLAELRGELRTLCGEEELRGTILLSPEGINLFVAGAREGIDALLTRVREIPGLEEIDVKESYSDERPFRRMLVKIKQEIIAFGVEGIDPRNYTSRRIAASELKRWLDEGRPVTLLDTRNDFEVRAGTFEKAIAIGVDDFRDFPHAVKRLPEEIKQQPVVTFCTGGIRCEKAAPFLEQAGFQEVFQLDGGILKYFEECGDAHYRGDCFVFDQRVALNSALEECDHEQCFACQAVVTVEEQSSPHYIVGESCPHCFRSPEQVTAELLDERHAALHRVTKPLPGSAPYDQVRPVSVPLRCDGMELLDFLDAMNTHLSRDEWQAIAAAGRLVCRDEAVFPGRVVRSGERIWHHQPALSEPDVNADIRILYEDDAIVVVDKPAPLPMHPCGRFHRNTLTEILNSVYAPLKLRPAHRLDADTSGVVVFSKSQQIAKHLQPQFEAGDVEKTYLARVIGRPSSDRIVCRLPIGQASEAGGVRVPDENGDPASTSFEVVERFSDGTALLRVHPLTGRTNQIRAHAWALGHPIVGDPIYRANGKLGEPRTLSVGDPPLCLHAAELTFTHPKSGERVTFKAERPVWVK